MKVKNQEYLNAFGKNLKELIESRGLSPEYVATHANLETKQIYRVINGEHSATLSIIYAIAVGLEIHPKELFDFTFTDKGNFQQKH